MINHPIVPQFNIEDCQISCNHHILWADFNSIQILCNLHLDIFATVVHLQERGGKAKGRMVTHFQSHLFSFTISFFLSLSLSFNAQIKSQKIDPMPKIGLLDRSRERSADPNIKYYMAGLFLDWLKSYFQWKQTSIGTKCDQVWGCS